MLSANQEVLVWQIKIYCNTQVKTTSKIECNPRNESDSCPFEYSYDNGIVYHICQCLRSDPTKTVCGLGTSDNLYIKAIEAEKKHYKEYSSKMHTWMRRSFVDKELIKAYYLGTSFSYYYGLDNCVLDAMSENLPKLGPMLFLILSLLVVVFNIK